MRHRQIRFRSRKKLTGIEGFDFVRCRIWGDHRRVISGRHLSKHEVAREQYMAEYRLSPDELIAKSFRVFQSSLPEFDPNGKPEWIVAIKRILKKSGVPGLWRLQKNHPHLYRQGVWLFGGIDEGFRFAGFNPEEIRLHGSWEEARLHKEIWHLRKQKLPLYPNYVMKHHHKIFQHARSNHGAWTGALIAHGIPPPPKRFQLHLLIRLRDTRESGAKLSAPLHHSNPGF